jgi:hypothetical protein
MSSSLRFLIFISTLLVLSFGQINSATIWGNCTSFAVHAATSVSFNGALTTVSDGNIGVSSGVSLTGNFALGSGTVENDTLLARNCATDKTSTFGILMNLTCPPSNVLAAEDLGGLTILPGVWCSASGTLTLTTGTTLTLNGNGISSSIWVFQTQTTLITATSTSFILQNGAQASNVYWVIGSSATIGVTSSFIGHVIAAASISSGTGSTISGRALAGAAVTFAGGNTIGINYNASSPTNAPVSGTPSSTNAPVSGTPSSTNAPVFGTPGTSSSSRPPCFAVSLCTMITIMWWFFNR